MVARELKIRLQRRARNPVAGQRGGQHADGANREASTTCPLRSTYMYQPTNKAIGTVQAMVNVPHELPATACMAPAGSVIVRSAAGANGLTSGVSSAPRSLVTVKPSLRSTSVGWLA